LSTNTLSLTNNKVYKTLDLNMNMPSKISKTKAKGNRFLMKACGTVFTSNQEARLREITWWFPYITNFVRLGPKTDTWHIMFRDGHCIFRNIVISSYKDL